MAWVSGIVVCGYAVCAHTCILTDDSVKSRYVAIYRCHVAMLNYLAWAIMLYKLLTVAQGLVLEALWYGA